MAQERLRLSEVCMPHSYIHDIQFVPLLPQVFFVGGCRWAAVGRHAADASGAAQTAWGPESNPKWVRGHWLKPLQESLGPISVF